MSKSYLNSFIYSFLHSFRNYYIHVCMYELIDWLMALCRRLDTVSSIGVRERIHSETNIFVIQREKLLLRLSKTQEWECFDMQEVVSIVDYCWKFRWCRNPKVPLNLDAYRTLLTLVRAIYIKKGRWGLDCDCPEFEHFILAAITHSLLC